MNKRKHIDLDALAQQICNTAKIDGLFLTSGQGLILAESEMSHLDLEGSGAVITGSILPNVMNIRAEHSLPEGSWFRIEIGNLPIFSVRYFSSRNDSEVKTDTYCIVVSYDDISQLKLGEIEGRVKEKLLSVL